MSVRLPGPGVLTAWLAATVPAPLVVYEWTHRWEEDQPLSTALWWPVLGSPVLAAVVAARQPRRPMAAVGVSTLVTATLLAVSLAYFRWVVPLTGEARWGQALLTGAALAVAGALIGYAVGGRLPHRARPASRRGYLVGGPVHGAGRRGVRGLLGGLLPGGPGLPCHRRRLGGPGGRAGLRPAGRLRRRRRHLRLGGHRAGAVAGSVDARLPRGRPGGVLRGG
ncbi:MULTISPECIES: hypothetical protein [unclassified Micromonospora]|uniref:hypothetical protein n=1 Tax=unclassified Micromonospora TaxID=2617518 RepID=UPI0020B3B07A|nr:MULTISPECIES: hypothetical protein [unclassified Micromonospora]MDM4778597.1 hypothetical protein [Micromonospora sp. b486]